MTKTDFVCAMVCGLMAAATLTGAAPSAAREAIAVLQLDPNAQLVKSNQPDLTIIEAHPTFGPNTGGMLGGADIFVSDPTVRHRYDCVPALTMYSFGTWMPVSYEVNPYQYKGAAEVPRQNNGIFSNGGQHPDYSAFLKGLSEPEVTYQGRSKWYDIPGKCGAVFKGQNPASPAPICQISCVDTLTGRYGRPFAVEVVTGYRNDASPTAPGGFVRTPFIADFKLYDCSDKRDISTCVPATDDLIKA